jgi:hypothetical protein
MKRNRLYTTVIEKTDPEGAKITVKPSKYLKKMHPEDVIAELQAHIQSLKDDLMRYSQTNLSVVENRKTINKLGSEFDVAKMYLAHFKQTYEALH